MSVNYIVNQEERSTLTKVLSPLVEGYSKKYEMLKIQFSQQKNLRPLGDTFLAWRVQKTNNASSGKKRLREKERYRPAAKCGTNGRSLSPQKRAKFCYSWRENRGIKIRLEFYVGRRPGGISRPREAHCRETKRFFLAFSANACTELRHI